MKKQQNPEGNNSKSDEYRDLSEASIERTEEGATTAARFNESEDMQAETTQGPVSKPNGDDWAENKVATSIDED